MRTGVLGIGKRPHYVITDRFSLIHKGKVQIPLHLNPGKSAFEALVWTWCILIGNKMYNLHAGTLTDVQQNS